MANIKQLIFILEIIKIFHFWEIILIMFYL